MIDRYIIEEQTTDTGFKYVLIETGIKPMPLGEYASRTQAETSKAEWIARDDLVEKISDFFTEMETKFEGRLSEKEVRQMIKEYD